MKIQGPIALVTGASRALGKAIVSGLLEAGAAKIYAAARDEPRRRREGGARGDRARRRGDVPGPDGAPDGRSVEREPL